MGMGLVPALGHGAEKPPMDGLYCGVMSLTLSPLLPLVLQFGPKDAAMPL